MAQPDRPSAAVHVLKVTLRDVRPAVWRRLEVPSAITLGELHDVLQQAFGWDGDHLHDFRVRGDRYTPGLPDLYGSPWMHEQERDEDLTLLARVAPRVGDVLDYTYDFGDDWQHRIEVEDVGGATPDVHYPTCTAGSGLPPEEDTGHERPGRFDDRARQALNRRLRQTGAVAGRDLPVDDAVLDPVFTGIFPDLTDDDESGECPCGCGASGSGVDMALPTLKRAPDPELAALAAQTSLVQRAVALATWLGPGRALTPSRVLRPADALAATDDLDLAAALLPSQAGGRGAGLDAADADDPDTRSDDLDTRSDDLADRQDGARPAQEALDLFGEVAAPAAPRRAGRRGVRSAKDLPYLHPVWVGCVAAGLIDVHGGKAYPGPGLAVWQGPAAAAERVESWAALLAGYLRARDDAARADRGYFAGTRGQVLQASIPVMYALAREPIPSGALALALAELDETAGPAALLALPLLMTEVAAATEDWLVAGVVEVPAGADGTVANVLGEQIGELRSGIQGQLALMARGPDGPESAAELGIALTAVIDALVEGPMLRLTPLGGYGLARLLAAHGWDVPEAGACADVASGDLLDRLTAYTPRDALDEMNGWLDAREDRWAEALREVIWSAAVTGEDGPDRRAVLPGLLYAAGPRVASVLDGVQGDPWLSAVVAVARDLLGVGPPVTLAQRLWLAVDGLYLDVDDDLDDFEEALQDSDLPELLAEPGAVAAAVGLDHPHTREVLRAAAPHLDDPQLKRSLRKALTGKSGNPALRVVAGRGGRGREAGSGGRGRRN